MKPNDLLCFLYYAFAATFPLPVIGTAWRVDAMGVVVALLFVSGFHVALAVQHYGRIRKRRAERMTQPPFTTI